MSALGRVRFEWEAYTGASQYRLEILTPNGMRLEALTPQAFHERYLETLPSQGEYVWEVAALDGAGSVLCAAGPFAFSKLSLPSTATAEKGGGEEGRPGSGTGGGPESGGTSGSNSNG